MRRFALGCLCQSPAEFEKMLVGDFLDAMTGWNDAETERNKLITGLIRRSTTILWNIQVRKEDKLKAEELWPLPWDETPVFETITDEEYNQRIERQKRFFELIDGNSNK